tara:strand:+ start:180 stop:845 length:666 start_codon:yes stop_codon:yes gene_type:complete
MSILSGFGTLRFQAPSGDKWCDLVELYSAFMDAQDFSDTNKNLPKIPWEKRKSSGIIKIRPLSQKTDIFYIISYLMEFRGCRERAINDPEFYVTELMNISGNTGSLWDHRVLKYFHWLWVKSDSVETYKSKLDEMRAAATKFYLDNWIAISLKDIASDNNSLSNMISREIKQRLNVLIASYGDEWQSYIWRALSIDEIGNFLDDYCKEYKEIEDEKREAAR